MTALPRFRALVPLAAAAALLGGCERKPAEAAAPVRPALTVVVEPAAPPAERRFTGTVAPRYEAKLGFQATGRMTARNVDVGDRVVQGRMLATLDPTVLRLAVVGSKADLANARAALVNAKATNDRQQELIRTGSVSQAQVDAALAARDTAQAKVGQAQASLQKAEEQLGYASLRSGYDGVVESWTAEVGQVVAAGQAVVTVARPDLRDAVFDVPDDRVARFAAGRAFTVALLADPAVSAQATVREIAPQSDQLTRTRRVRLTLEAAPAAFRLGTTVTLGLVEAVPGPARIVLPAGAAVERDGATTVWTVDPQNRLRARAVTLGERDPGTVTVATGLAAGDRVLIAGAHSATEGQAVKIDAP